MNIGEYIGKRINNWTILSQEPSNKYNRKQCKVRCDCGKECITIWADVFYGRSKKCKSCGSRIKPYLSLFNLLKHSAKKKKYSVSLTYEDFLEFIKTKNCHYCNCGVSWQKYLVKINGKSQNRYNLDRKNNDIGYTKENCVVCCSTCNRVKNKDFSYEQMLILGETIGKIKRG